MSCTIACGSVDRTVQGGIDGEGDEMAAVIGWLGIPILATLAATAWVLWVRRPKPREDVVDSVASYERFKAALQATAAPSGPGAAAGWSDGSGRPDRSDGSGRPDGSDRSSRPDGSDRSERSDGGDGAGRG